LKPKQKQTAAATLFSLFISLQITIAHLRMDFFNKSAANEVKF